MSIENRPWGYYNVLYDVSECKVKHIEVNPQQRLSYQYHDKRQEQWTVTHGELTVVLDDVEYTLQVGESIDIPLGCSTAFSICTVPKN
jgi:mannose-6-phosphate isomerase